MKILSFIKLVIFPVEKSELKLLSRLATLLFCILFNFSSLRTLKDSLIIPIIGAEAISFLKLWLVLPSAIFFTILYVKLSNHLNLSQLFLFFVSFFIGFFLIFAFIIYPNQHSFHTSELEINALAQNWPHLKWFIKLSGKWSYVVVYILAELWGAMIINLMFWQFVNHLFKSQQAKRIYPILAMIGNIGLICAGNLLIFFARIENFSLETVKFVSIDHDKIEVAIKLIIISVTISGIIAIGLFRNVYNNYVENHSDGIYVKDTKTHLTLRHSVKLILSSRYIFYVSILVISYGLTMNILEGPWKAKLSELYTNPCDYIEFMGNFNIWMGVSSVIMTIIGGNILRYFGWVTSAYITPVMITITGSLFFTFVVFGKKINLGFDPIYAAVMIGAIQNILSKSSKNSLFDSTKEMAYIPLSIELKTKGKAAVEIMGAKIGKSMGAFLQFLAFTIMPDLDFDRISIFLMLIFIAIAILWLIDVNKLSKEYNKSYNAQNN